jgi:DNA-directed RNA polymerase specialized sigma24 family protein
MSVVHVDEFDSPSDHLRFLTTVHGRAVAGLVSVHERDVMTAEELVADVFVLAYDHLDEIGDLSQRQVQSWLLRTARFLVANEARRGAARRRRVELLRREPLPLVSGADDEFFEIEARLEESVRSQRIGAALDLLSTGDRDVLVWDANGEKGPAIAERLGIGHDAARKRLSRARAAFLSAFDNGAASIDGGDGR